jgi:hypothetical protein
MTGSREARITPERRTAALIREPWCSQVPAPGEIPSWMR